MKPAIRWGSAVVLRPVQIVVYWLSGLVPRDPRRWALGCWSGRRFGDNAGAVFLEASTRPRSNLEVAWITRDRSIRDQLRADGHRAHLAWSPGGIWWTVRSGVFVYDSLPKDVNYWLSRRARLVLLRHGVGVKKIERAIDAHDHRLWKLFHGSGVQRAMWRFALPSHCSVPDLVMSCSPTHASQAPWFFGVDHERVRVTGSPRLDRLAAEGPEDRTAIPTVGRAIPTNGPLFLYVPTFREGMTRQRFQWSVLQEAAASAGVTIAVKLHYIDAERGVLGLDSLATLPNLRMIDPHVDLVEVYPHCDGMISDFSSCPFDFVLLDRPILYYVPDEASFSDSRPLIYELEDVAVGPLCRDGDELATALGAAVSGDFGVPHEKYVVLRERFHTYPRGGAAERVIDAIVEEFVIDRGDVRVAGRFDYLDPDGYEPDDALAPVDRPPHLDRHRPGWTRGGS